MGQTDARKGTTVGAPVSVTIQLSAADHTQMAAMAKRSDLTLERWLRSAAQHSCFVDQAHWKEMDDREEIRRTVDRKQFALISQRLAELPSGVVDLLVEALVLAQQRGRFEGSRSAMRLAALRQPGPVVP